MARDVAEGIGARRGRGDEARVIRAFCEWLTGQGWDSIETEIDFCDVVARRDGQILFAEAKGHTAAPGTDVDTMFGQILRRMPLLEDANARFAVVVPATLLHHVLRVSQRVRAALRIDVYAVDESGAVEPIHDR